MHQLDQAADLPAPIPANFPARSGHQAYKPPFDAARKYDEVGIPVEKTRKPPSLPVPILAHIPSRSGRLDRAPVPAVAHSPIKHKR